MVSRGAMPSSAGPGSSAVTPRAPAVITLTTDFGTLDTYVAEMKAAILGITRSVHLVDLTHAIEPQDVLGGAFALERAALRFPPASIHVAVVDPGVGTSRRGLVVKAGGHFFVGPDNGLFTPFLTLPGAQAFELAAPQYRSGSVSTTFHGRDVFAPAAAHLALGVAPGSFGPAVPDPVRLPDLQASADATTGVIVHVDRFGNLVTSIRREAVTRLGAGMAVRVAGRQLPLVGTYGDLGRSGVGALIGSGGRLEIAVRDGSAARVLRVGRGAPVALSPRRSRRSRRSRTNPRALRTSPRQSS